MVGAFSSTLSRGELRSGFFARNTLERVFQLAPPRFCNVVILSNILFQNVYRRGNSISLGLESAEVKFPKPLLFERELLLTEPAIHNFII
jgi:hypothetical protein